MYLQDRVNITVRRYVRRSNHWAAKDSDAREKTAICTGSYVRHTYCYNISYKKISTWIFVVNFLNQRSMAYKLSNFSLYSNCHNLICLALFPFHCPFLSPSHPSLPSLLFSPLPSHFLSFPINSRYNTTMLVCTFSTYFNCPRVATFKVLQSSKIFGKNKIEDRPQLWKVIFHRCSRQRDS